MTLSLRMLSELINSPYLFPLAQISYVLRNLNCRYVPYSNFKLNFQKQDSILHMSKLFLFILTVTLNIIIKVISSAHFFYISLKTSLAFAILTQNLSKAHFDISNFDRPTKMSTKGKRDWYIEFIILLSIRQGSVNMNSYWPEKREIRVLLLHL